MEFSFQDASDSGDVPGEDEIGQWLRAALEQDGKLTVRLVDEQEMSKLNDRYRHKQGPTNVLSFPFEDPPGVRSGILGDIVICAPVVRREAKEQNKTVQSQWAHMVVHGVMHLQGYNHETGKEALEMEKRETGVMKELGFPAPYEEN
ncbi:MAG: rRNA maturation RNase YbeY [Acidiferrobacterales bacterium]